MTSSRHHSSHDLHLISSAAMWLCAAAAVLAMSTARAANTSDDVQAPANAESMTPKQAYEHDKAYCASGQSTQPRAACLKEAARAYQEARAGKLDSDAGTASSGPAPRHQAHRAGQHHGKKAQTSTSGTSGTSSSGTSSTSSDNNGSSDTSMDSDSSSSDNSSTDNTRDK